MSQIDPALAHWLDSAAGSLDTETGRAGEVLTRLAAGGVLSLGIAPADGGAGGTVSDAVEAIAAVSERSMAAGFVFWGHRAYVEYLLHSTNRSLREKLLPDLIAGRLAGATGLSNAMKFLSGLEDLQITSTPRGDGFTLDGKMAWVTNLRPEGFHVAAAVSGGASGAFIASLAHDDPGLVRSADLELLGMRGTNTAAVQIDHVDISPERIIAGDAAAWLPRVRPSFLGLQCGMSIGLARRTLREAKACLGSGRHALAEPLADISGRLHQQEAALHDGLRSGAFQGAPAALFNIRIALAEIVAEAVGLELQAAGGRAYLAGPGAGFARRWREAAFVPIVTPSLVQLKAALAA